MQNERQTPALFAGSGPLPARPLPLIQELPLPKRPDAPSKEADSISYREIALRYWWLILASALFGAAGGIGAAYLQTPTYRAYASLEIRPFNDNFLNMRDIAPTTAATSLGGQAFLETQAELLRSRLLIGTVVDRLGMPRMFADARCPDGWYRRLRASLGAPVKQLDPREEAIEAASQSLQISWLGTGHIIKLQYDSPDPRLAALFLNHLSQEYMDRSLESRWSSTQRISRWLTQRLEDLRISLQRSENELQAYARRAGLLFTGEKENVAEEKLRQVQQELSLAQADLYLKQARYQVASETPPEALPEVLDNATLREYQTKLADLQRQHAELTASFKPSYYRVKEVDAQVEQLRRTVDSERSRLMERIRTEYERAKLREVLLKKAYTAQASLVAGQSDSAVRYNLLKREVESNRQLYDALMQKMKEAGVASAMNVSNIGVVDTAEMPSLPYSPRPKVNALLGMAGGLFIGLLAIVLKEGADRRFRTPGEASNYLELRELAVIPSAEYGNRRLRQAFPLGMFNRAHEPGLIEPHSMSLFADSFRVALTSLLLSANQRPRVIVVGSAGAREGKSTIVSNLGIPLAANGCSTLLIDGDIRKPELHRTFDLKDGAGICDILKGGDPIAEVDLERFVQATRFPGLKVLPCGTTTVSMWSHFYSGRLAQLLQRVRAEFQVVIIDTPPLLSLPDARIFGQLSDGVILVIRAAGTNRESALLAKRELQQDGTPLLGLILNDWVPSGRTGYYSYFRTEQ